MNSIYRKKNNLLIKEIISGIFNFGFTFSILYFGIIYLLHTIGTEIDDTSILWIVMTIGSIVLFLLGFISLIYSFVGPFCNHENYLSRWYKISHNLGFTMMGLMMLASFIMGSSGMLD